jgi:tRNA threonylcarbamoyladenosine biosynthesis protein TsaB
LSILLIECSSKKISFGFGNDEKLIFESSLKEEFHADTLTIFIKEASSKLNIDLRNLKYISLSNGPGSFTGLRIGSAIAKGICHASGSKLIEIPTLDIIANKYKSGKDIISLIYSNMKSGEFYYCRYRFENDTLIRKSEYGLSPLEEIISGKGHSDLVSNDSIESDHINVSERSDIGSQYELSRFYIENSLFSDHRTSQPFYMKEFIQRV